MKAEPASCLVVEDGRNIARLLQLELEHRGLRVPCAYDDPSGLKATAGWPLVSDRPVRKARRRSSAGVPGETVRSLPSHRPVLF